jgi:isocitrate/isopropylmalate dehydrogenase
VEEERISHLAFKSAQEQKKVTVVDKANPETSRLWRKVVKR